MAFRLSPVMTIMANAAQKASKRLLRDFNEVEQLQVSVKGPGNVTFTGRSVERRRKPSASSSTGRVRRMSPTILGTGIVLPALLVSIAGCAASTPSSAATK